MLLRDGSDDVESGIPGDVQYDTAAQDARDAQTLYDLLEHEVLPLFYDRDARGIPRRWVQRIKHSLRTIGPRFVSRWMLDDYTSRVYAAS
jgi:starch phosphorylase